MRFILSQMGDQTTAEQQELFLSFFEEVVSTFESDLTFLYTKGLHYFTEFQKERFWVQNYHELDKCICYLVEYYPIATWAKWPRPYDELRPYFYQMGVVPIDMR